MLRAAREAQKVEVGPVRGSTVGNALLFAAGIVSSFALPAWLVAVVRFGERRSLWRLTLLQPQLLAFKYKRVAIVTY